MAIGEIASRARAYVDAWHAGVPVA
jgi:hypothetical protein